MRAPLFSVTAMVALVACGNPQAKSNKQKTEAKPPVSDDATVELEEELVTVKADEQDKASQDQILTSLGMSRSDACGSSSCEMLTISTSQGKYLVGELPKSSFEEGMSLTETRKLPADACSFVIKNREELAKRLDQRASYREGARILRDKIKSKCSTNADGTIITCEDIFVAGRTGTLTVSESVCQIDFAEAAPSELSLQSSGTTPGGFQYWYQGGCGQVVAPNGQSAGGCSNGTQAWGYNTVTGRVGAIGPNGAVATGPNGAVVATPNGVAIWRRPR